MLSGFEQVTCLAYSERVADVLFQPGDLVLYQSLSGPYCVLICRRELTQRLLTGEMMTWAVWRALSDDGEIHSLFEADLELLQPRSVSARESV